MKISIVRRKTIAIEEFEGTEWPIADVEHYGRDDVEFKAKHYFLKAEQDGTIWGILQMKIRAGVCTVSDVLVSHEKRGQGIGKKLMHEAEKIATKQGAHKIFLITGRDWKAADFYKSLGYKVTGERQNDLAHADFIEFAKFLGSLL